jgi:hypothetical protein
MKPRHASAIWFLLLAQQVYAADLQSHDKAEYSLLNPVPSDALRPLATSAYDSVLDARTVDAGHVQIDGSFIDYYFNSPTIGSYLSDTFAWAPRITVGLLNNVDFSVRPSYVIRRLSHEVLSSRFERINTGVNVNLFGNDNGTFALALKPYLSIPTSDNVAFGGGDILGGGIVAMLVRLPYEMSVKVNSEFYATEKRDQTVLAGFYNAISVNKTLCSKAEAYCYFDTTITTDSSETWLGYTGLGLKYNITTNLQLFAGFGFGVTPDWVFGQTRAYDYNPRAGFVWRY